MPVAFAVSSFGARRIPPFSSYGGILSAVDSTALFFGLAPLFAPHHAFVEKSRFEVAGDAARPVRTHHRGQPASVDGSRRKIVKSPTLLDSNRPGYPAAGANAEIPS
jgi:hypothetical protein